MSLLLFLEYDNTEIIQYIKSVRKMNIPELFLDASELFRALKIEATNIVGKHCCIFIFGLIL